MGGRELRVIHVLVAQVALEPGHEEKPHRWSRGLYMGAPARRAVGVAYRCRPQPETLIIPGSGSHLRPQKNDLFWATAPPRHSQDGSPDP